MLKGEGIVVPDVFLYNVLFHKYKYFTLNATNNTSLCFTQKICIWSKL